jgi:hypothetical protein
MGVGIDRARHHHPITHLIGFVDAHTISRFFYDPTVADKEIPDLAIDPI